MKKSIGWAIVLMFMIGGGYWYYSKSSAQYKSFRIWIINDLEKHWGNYLVYAVDGYLQENSDRYSESIEETLKSTSPDKIESYKNIMKKWENYATGSRSGIHNSLVKKTISLQRELRKKADEEKADLLKELSSKDVKIADEEIDARKEECYRLCLSMLERSKYDDVWYEVTSLTGEEKIVNDIAQLNLYFNGLPTLSIAFYRSTGGEGWVPFHYKIDCGSYLWKKEYMK